MSETVAVILAAGEGKRMQSDTAKVLHEMAGAPLLDHVLRAVEGAGIRKAVVVVGARREQVTAWLLRRPSGTLEVTPAVQAEQKGTGHALTCALPSIAHDDVGELVVLCGDAPLIRAETIRSLLALHRARHAGATILTADLDDPTGYGRIVRRPNGDVARIVEHRDATEEERALHEINSADYVFDARAVAHALTKVTNDNRQGEFYLTDTIALLAAEGRPILAFKVDDAREVLGVNTLEQLAQAEDAYLARGAGR